MATKTAPQTQTEKSYDDYGDTEHLPEFSGLYRCDGGCNTPAKALFFMRADNVAPLGLCGHHYTKNSIVIHNKAYALRVDKSVLKGKKAN